MQPDIRWLTAVYRAPEDRTSIGAPKTAHAKLSEMAGELVGTSGLVALYVPEGTDDVYDPGGKRGRVIGVVQLVSMPEGGKMEDYYHDDLDGSRRWPIGWPCKLICVPPVDQCPKLRDHVELLHGTGSFRGYVSRLQQGLFDWNWKCEQDSIATTTSFRRFRNPVYPKRP